jgi:hypothetical protein
MINLPAHLYRSALWCDAAEVGEIWRYQILEAAEETECALIWQHIDGMRSAE